MQIIYLGQTSVNLMTLICVSWSKVSLISWRLKTILWIDVKRLNKNQQDATFDLKIIVGHNDNIMTSWHTHQPKKKAPFSRSLREQKFSNANFRREISYKFAQTIIFLRKISWRNSAKTHRETPRTFAEKLPEISHRYSAKTLGIISKYVNSLNFCFVWFVVSRPSQQQWSCHDGQLT